MNRSLHLTLAAVLVSAAIGCAGARGAPRAAAVRSLPSPARPAVGLQLVVVPRDAEVDIEGVRRGPASALAAESAGVVALPPGVYRVSVRHPGYATWRAEVSVATGVERIEVTLAEQR